jgi:hypothetical protein
VVPIRTRPFDGDWLDGWESFLEGLAGVVLGPTAAPARDAGVAVVGYRPDRLEADHRANLDALRGLVEGLGLAWAGALCDGGPVASLARAATADLLVALPGGERAAALLAGRTGAHVVQAALPVGVGQTAAFLRAVAAAAGRPQAADAFLDARLPAVLPVLDRAAEAFLQDRAVAVATDPARVYQAKMGVRRRSSTTWASAACSIDRNGPTSLPLGLMTPMVPVMSSSQKLPVAANTAPAAAMSTRQKRLALHLPVEVRREDLTGTAFTELTRSLNVSGGGILFECRRPLGIGTRLVLAIELPPALRHHFGDHDVYTIVDLPDNESAAAVALTVNAAGGASVRTVVLLAPEEVDAAAKRSVEYRPPGG